MDMNTKILNEALSLFSRRGYSAIRVSEIASAVGIKAPSLYKHYASKQAIFDACVNRFTEQTAQKHDELGFPETPYAKFTFETATTENIIKIASTLFEFYLTDEVAAKFRRMLMLERYHNPKLDEVFKDIFINGAVEYETKVFAKLMDSRVIKKADPRLVALHFYTPIFYLLQKYDTEPENLAVGQAELSTLVREFCHTYQSQPNDNGV